jgi:hypothetical protein
MKYIIKIFIAAIFISVLLLLLKFFQIGRHVIENVSDNAIIIESRIHDGIIFEIIKHQGIYINSDIIISIQNDSTTIRELINNSGSFFFYIPAVGCQSCLHEILEAIEKHFGKRFDQDIIFITSHIAPHEYKKLISQFDIDIYYIGDEYLGFNSQREQDYFMFYLDSTFISSFYMPINVGSNLNNKYFKMCKAYIGNSSRYD